MFPKSKNREKKNTENTSVQFSEKYNCKLKTKTRKVIVVVGYGQQSLQVMEGREIVNNNKKDIYTNIYK